MNTLVWKPVIGIKLNNLIQSINLNCCLKLKYMLDTNSTGEFGNQTDLYCNLVSPPHKKDVSFSNSSISVFSL